MSALPRQLDTCIVALGARTPLGLRAQPSAMAAHAGIARRAEHPYMVDRRGDPLVVAMDSTLDVHPWQERMLALATSALDEVCETLPLSREVGLPLFLGLPELGRFFTEADATALCRRLAQQFGRAALQPAPVPEGNASPIVALERALAGVRAGTFPIAIVGGVESYLDPARLDALDAASRIAARTIRWGLCPGEGAAMFAVCKGTFARQYRLPILAWIGGTKVTHEPAAMHVDAVCTGEGLAQAMAAAAAAAGVSVTKQYCDIDGERYREHEFSFAILRVAPATFVDAIDYVAPANLWGQCGAAGAVMLATIPIVTHARGHSPGPWPMVWCGSEGGRRGAVVLHLPS